MKKRTYYLEILALLAYAFALIWIMYYHEPWFDEAQAWLIARDATMKDLFMSITHYEGHPPLWFLILMPFAKSGMPFEFGVKTVNFMLMTTAMGLLIFKAPFHRLIRCTLPFTYFFFYQYGVISRTYSLMLLGFVLSAITYKKRNEKPFLFIASLAIICGASAYGILISAGIALAWLMEIFDYRFSLKKAKDFIGSKRFKALLVLLIYNALLLMSIYPYADTYATNAVHNNMATLLFYMFYMAPGDAIGTFVFANNVISIMQVFFSIMISIILYFVLIQFTRIYQKQPLFVLPFLFFVTFCGVVYFWVHHIGIITMFYLFLIWCCLDQKEKDYSKSKIIQQLMQNEKQKRRMRMIGSGLLAVAIGISVYWSVAASIKDIKLNYGTGRESANFIKENKLEQRHIYVAWREVAGKTGETFYDYNSVQGIPTMAYFDRNIFCNFNKYKEPYLLHKIDRDQDYMKKLIQQEEPEVLFSLDTPEYSFGSEINMDDFALVKVIKGNTIWKDQTAEYKQLIYLRKDLLKEYPNLTPINQ